MCRIFLCLLICVVPICLVETVDTGILRDLSTLIPPCSTRVNEVLPRNSGIVVYFNDRYPDGSYTYGTILTTGERRYERGIFYLGSLHVDGFYSYRKWVNSRYVYETTRYTAGRDGYYPKRVEITYTPPKIPTIDDYPIRTAGLRQSVETTKN